MSRQKSKTKEAFKSLLRAWTVEPVRLDRYGEIRAARQLEAHFNTPKNVLVDDLRGETYPDIPLIKTEIKSIQSDSRLIHSPNAPLVSLGSKLGMYVTNAYHKRKSLTSDDKDVLRHVIKHLRSKAGKTSFNKKFLLALRKSALGIDLLRSIEQELAPARRFPQNKSGFECAVFFVQSTEGWFLIDREMMTKNVRIVSANNRGIKYKIHDDFLVDAHQTQLAIETAFSFVESSLDDLGFLS